MQIRNCSMIDIYENYRSSAISEYYYIISFTPANRLTYQLNEQHLTDAMLISILFTSIKIVVKTVWKIRFLRSLLHSVEML